MRPRLKVWIETEDGRVALSEWRVTLLLAVAQHGSLVAAARSLGVPRRTAWQRIQEMESSLGVRLLETVSGGVGGGRSKLSPAAQDFIRKYEALRAGWTSWWRTHSESPVMRRVLAVLWALVLLTGCAPSATTAPAATPVAPTAAPKPTTALAAAPQTTPLPRTGNDKEIILATTTSTQDSGLLDVLVPLFQQQTGYQVKTISIGTGAALALGARGEADVVLVHAPASEVQWMQQGNGTERVLVMHNDFLVIGPVEDPARIKGETDALAALKKIADAKAPFISRGDNSGTQQLELSLWQKINITPKGQPWYVESGTGMGQTLTIADQHQAYTISDRATWLAFSGRIQLPIMVERDPVLLNVYHVMPVNPARFPNVPINTAGGKAFADFMIAPETQKVIGEFGKDKYGQALFVPDAGKSEAEVGL